MPRPARRPPPSPDSAHFTRDGQDDPSDYEGIALLTMDGTRARVLVALMALGPALGILLVARRAAGHLTMPLSPLPLVATAVVLVAWSLCLQLIARPRRKSSLCLPVATLLLFAAGCSYPGDRWIDWLTWVPAVAAVGLLWSVPRQASLRMPARRRAAPITDDILQQWTRFRTPAGLDAVRGTVMAEFAAGERSAALFVAFCPAFERLPHVEAQVADDSAAGVKVAQRLHQGAQLEVRLTEPAEEAFALPVEVFAAEPELDGVAPAADRV